MTCNPRYKVLVVEDDALIAADLEQILTGKGFDVIGPFPDPGRALAALRVNNVDAAVLDINLGGEMIEPVADALAEACIPFVWASGYDKQAAPHRHRDRVFLQKPFAAGDLVAAVTQSVAGKEAY